jgi:hypothetical protein
MERYKVLINQNIHNSGGIEFKEVDIQLCNPGGDSLLIGKADGTFSVLKGADGSTGQVIKIQSDGSFAFEYENPATDPTKIIEDDTQIAVVDNGTDPGVINVIIDDSALFSITGDGIIPSANEHMSIGNASKALAILYTETLSHGANSASVVNIVDAVAKRHHQNTDEGTTNVSFTIDSGVSEVDPIELKATSFNNPFNDSSVRGLYINNGATTPVALPIKAGVISATHVFSMGTEPSDIDGSDSNRILVTREWVNEKLVSAIGANDAMVFIGVVAPDGTIQPGYNQNITGTLPAGTKISDLTAYSAGWTFKFNGSGTWEGYAIEENDTVMCTSDYASAYSAGDWYVFQGNIDVANFVKKTDYNSTYSILGSQGTANTPVKITAGTDTVLLRQAGNISFAKITGDHIENTTITGAKLDDNTVEFAQITTVNNNTLLGNNSGSLGDVIAIPHTDVKTMLGIDPQSGTYQNVPSSALTGANVISQITVTGYGTVSGVTSRPLTFADLLQTTAPASPTTTGTLGQIAIDEHGNFLYLCVTAGGTGSAKWIRFAGSSSNWVS